MTSGVSENTDSHTTRPVSLLVATMRGGPPAAVARSLSRVYQRYEQDYGGGALIVAAAFVDSGSSTFAGFNGISPQTRNQFRGPNYFDMDMSLFKTFRLKERKAGESLWLILAEEIRRQRRWLIFNGLAISLIFGILMSTLLTLVVIPVLYYAVNRERDVAEPGRGH